MKLVPDLRERLAKLSPEDRKVAEDAIREIEAVQAINPLALASPHPTGQQREFIAAQTLIVAAFASNRWGKTTGLTWRAARDCLPEDWLPRWLKASKRWGPDNAPDGTFGRIVSPSFKQLAGVILPSFRKWIPPGALRGGSFDKAYKGAPDYKLHFADGGWIEFMTHEQDLDKFGGAALHFVGYDEPPPQDIREECKYRLIDFNGYEMFACTPLKVNVSWMRRDIFKNREHLDITVCRGSIYENPTLSQEAIKSALEMGDPRLRPAREYGDFVDVGGLVYPDFERCVIKTPPSPAQIREWDNVVGIDPGIRNAGFAFVGFDTDNMAIQWDEGLLQDRTPVDYADFIRATLQRVGLAVEDCLFVIDPAARARSAVNAETVASALAREGIYTVPGQNDVDAGIQQGLTRMQHGRFKCSELCRLTRDEADEYAAEDRGDGVFKPVKVNDHILDALRYVWMQRPFDPVSEDDAPDRQLGWQPNTALPSTAFRVPKTSAPMGSMS